MIKENFREMQNILFLYAYNLKKTTHNINNVTIKEMLLAPFPFRF